jgi:peptidyl-prolyl cis-trans isomerase D
LLWLGKKIYFDLIKSSIYLTNSESTSQFHYENDKVDIEYLRIPFEAIPDSVIKIRESEISSFLKNNRDKYEIEESKKWNMYSFLMLHLN